MEGTVSSELVRGLMELAEQVGISLDEFRPLLELERVPEIRYRRIWTVLEEHSDGSELWLRMAANLTPGRFGLIDYCIRTTPTFGEALSEFCRRHRVINGCRQLSLTTEAKDARLVTTAPHAPPSATEWSVAAMHTGFQQICPNWQPSKIRFAHASSDQKALARFFKCEVEMEQHETSMTFPMKVLGEVLVDSDGRLHEILAPALQEADAQLQEQRPWLDEVRMIVEAELVSGGGTRESVAAKLHMSSRTFQRRLQDHGVDSFSEFLNQIRQELAETLLADNQETISQIAARLGYANDSNFVRAFRRWVGKTPAAYRATANGSDD